MITIRAGRARPKDRKPTESDKTVAGQMQSYPAAGGLVTATSKAAGAGAVVLENFWPTSSGYEPRGGLQLIGGVSSPIVRLMEYRAGAKKFAATQSSIYPFSNGDIETPAVTGKSSGEWSSFEVQNSGGSFLIAVNGADPALRYNGTIWENATITGVDTTLLTHVWGHRNRLFFVQRGSLSAWYLGTNSIGGAAVELPLSATFSLGGSLIAGGTWSSDSGDGLDDKCVFITDAGEVAIFSGSDPGDINNWSLDGVFYVGEILGPRAITSLAGDLIFATKGGIIPLSGAVQKDPAELAAVSLTAPIEPDWQRAVANSPVNWRLCRWESGQMLLACPTGGSSHFVANLQINAWASVTGWPAADVMPLGAELYIGSETGNIYRAWAGGTDAGDPFICRAQLAHDSLGSASGVKVAHQARSAWRHVKPFKPSLSIATNYDETFPLPPDFVDQGDEAGGFWDTSSWDTTSWGAEEAGTSTKADWETVWGVGNTLSVQIQVTSNSAGRLRAQLQRVDLLYSAGGIDL